MAVVLKKQTSSAGAGLAVDVALLIEQPKSALLPVLRRLNKWEEASEETITVEQFSGAMTNMVYRCGLLAENGQEQQVVLMRVHASSSDLFDRQEEILTFRGVSAAGMGPKLLMLFDNGRVEEFLAQHVTLAASDLQDTMVSSAIAHTVAHFHVKMSEALASADHMDDVLVWKRLRSWIELAREHATAEELKALGMNDLEHEVDRFESIMMSTHPCWIALCHNDLQYGNIMALTAAYSSSAGGAAPDQAAAAAAPNLGQAASSDHTRDLGAGAATAADHTADQLANLQISSPAAAAAARAGDPPAAAAGSSQPISVTVQALQQHHEQHISTAAAAAGGPGTHWSNEESHMAVAGTSPAHSVTSVGSFRHRTAGPSVQLPDGSIVLPGMKARPRGQSPERGKRPDYFSSCSPQRAGSSTVSIAAAGSSALSISSSSAADLAAAAAGLKPPSAAAVLRHAASGDLNAAGTCAAAAAAADRPAAAAASGRRRQRISSSGLDTSESAEDSEDADVLLPHQGLGVTKLTSVTSGTLGAGVRGVAVDQPAAAAAAASSARRYRQIRKERKTPPAGFEFPTFEGSDAGDDLSSSSSSSDYGSSDESPDPKDDQPCVIGGSSSSLSRSQARPDSDPAAVAAAAAPGSSRHDVTVTLPNNSWNDGALTLIDYEYAGSNPVAFDIANHWCEWAADYHTDEPHVLDFTRLPSEHQQFVFVQEYLQALLTGLGITVPDPAAAAAAGSTGSSNQLRPDDLWSVVSSVGGSVLSMPETEAFFNLKPDQSDNLSVKSFSSMQSEQQQQQLLPPQQQQQKLSFLAPAGDTSAAAAASPAELRHIWRWIDLFQPDRVLLTQHNTLDLACWNRMCRALTEASRAYMAASHLLWALWGVIQSKVSDVDFDFDGYGVQRWNMYLATRPAALQQQQ